MLAVVTVSGLTLSPGPASAAQRALERPLLAEPGSIDPQQSLSAGAGGIIQDLFVGLLAPGPNGEAQAACAQSWNVDAQGKVYRFKLRPNLRWSDGTALTSEDFVYSLRRLLRPETAAPLAADFFVIANGKAVHAGRLPPEALGVSAPDSSTVSIELERPAPHLPQLLAAWEAVPVPRHVIEQRGAGWTDAGVMVSNGAYRLRERTTGAAVVLEKNPHFFDAPAVSIEVVNYPILDNPNTALQRFHAGQFDVLHNFPAEMYDWLKQHLPDAVRLAPLHGTYYYVVNTQHPPFDDPQIRSVLSMAIDRDIIAERLLGTGERPAYDLVPPGTQNYRNDTIPAFRLLDLERRIRVARTVLKEKGYGDAFPLTLTLRYSPALVNDRKIAVAIAAMWRRIGIMTQILPGELVGPQSDLRSGQFDVASFGLVRGRFSADLFLSAVDPEFPELNVGRYDNPQVTQLLRTARAANDDTQRAALLQQAGHIVAENYVVLPIYHYASRTLVAPSIAGWVDNPTDSHVSRFLSFRGAAN